MKNPLMAYFRFLIRGFLTVGIIGAIIIIVIPLVSSYRVDWRNMPFLSMALGLAGIFTGMFLHSEEKNLSERDQGFLDATGIALVIASIFTWIS